MHVDDPKGVLSGTLHQASGNALDALRRLREVERRLDRIEQHLGLPPIGPEPPRPDPMAGMTEEQKSEWAMKNNAERFGRMARAYLARRGIMLP